MAVFGHHDGATDLATRDSEQASKAIGMGNAILLLGLQCLGGLLVPGAFPLDLVDGGQQRPTAAQLAKHEGTVDGGASDEKAVATGLLAQPFGIGTAGDVAIADDRNFDLSAEEIVKHFPKEKFL